MQKVILKNERSYFVLAMRERGGNDWALEFGDPDKEVAFQEFDDRVYSDGHEYQFLIWECLEDSTKATAADLAHFNSDEYRPIFKRLAGAEHVKLRGARAYL